MAKPEIIVNGGTAGAMTSVSASSAWEATLDSTDGVRRVEWSVSSTDETTAAASYTLVQSGSVGQNVAGTSQGQGTGIILKVVVNAGNVGDQPDPTNTSATVKIVVPLSDGGIVGCAGEEYESDATFGAAGIINSGIRKAAALSPSGVAVKIVRAATAAALPTNTRTGNVLTATSNAAIGTVGGVVLAAGDYFLVQNEGGGASHVNNGAFYLSQQGDGSNPWKATRAAYFDDSAELIAMTTFRVQEGTYAGKERYLVTSGATINVTALEFGSYAYAPVDPAYLMVGASGDLANERNISAIGTTLDFASTTTIPLQASRTDAATAALVDVETVSALSSGSAAAGFGPAIKFLGEVSGGGAENYGRVGFAATDLTGGSEDTKAVFQARTAGAALATVAEFSGTAAKVAALAGSGSAGVEVDGDGNLTRGAGGGASASAHYLTDAAAAVNASDVPIQALPSTLAFAKTSEKLASFTVTAAAGSVYESIGVGHVVSASGAGTTGDGISIAARLVDATPSVRRVGRIRWEWISPVALTPRADFVVSVLSTDGEHDWLRLTDDGSLRLPAYNIAGRRPIFAGTDGTITATAIQFGEVQTALAGLSVGVLHEDGAGVLSSSAIVNADVDAAAAIAGTKISPDFGSQAVATTGAVTITKDALGTTKTRGFTSVNATASGSQVSAQIGLSASHSGGTQHSIGWQIEPQTASNALSVWYYGTGTGAPSSTAFYHASSDGNFGSAMFADAWVCRSTSTTGFRFDQSSNRGGMDQDGSNNLRLKSYSGNGFLVSIYSDAGSTLVSNPITVNGSGQGYAQFIPTTPTSATNALTINLTTSQHVDHALTEDTTVTITGGVNGQEGTIVFSQPASAKTVTMPTNGVGVEYANDIIALTTTGIIDTTNLTRTVLSYRVLANGKAFIKHRAVGLIP